MPATPPASSLLQDILDLINLCVSNAFTVIIIVSVNSILNHVVEAAM